MKDMFTGITATAVTGASTVVCFMQSVIVERSSDEKVFHVLITAIRYNRGVLEDIFGAWVLTKNVPITLDDSVDRRYGGVIGENKRCPVVYFVGCFDLKTLLSA